MLITKCLLPMLTAYQCNAYAIASPVNDRAKLPTRYDAGPVGLSPDTKSTELTTRDANELALNERGFLDLVWNTAGNALPGIKLAMGGFGLVKSAYDAIKDCNKGVKFDCIFGVADTVFSYFLIQFALTDLRNGKRDVNEHGRAYNQDGSYLVAHVAIANGSTLHHAYTGSTNDSDWTHVATSYTAQGQPMHSLHYRLASPEDLGRPNNGDYHHIRAQHISNDASNSSSHSRRSDRASNGGVVADYLWTNGDKSLWNQLGGKSQANNLGSTIADYMENSNSQASCAVPGVQQSNGKYAGEDQGVLAYGWNNHAFKFNGRSGGWLDSCGAAGSSAPPPPPPPPPHVTCSPK